MAAQGALIFYLGMIWFYNWRMRKLDSELGIDDETVAWHDRQQSSSYADLCPLLPGPLGGNARQTLCPGDVLVRSVLAGKVIYTDRSVRCVLLPKKRSASA